MARKKKKRGLGNALGVGAALGFTNQIFKPSVPVRASIEIENVFEARQKKKKRQEAKERKARRKADK